MSVQTDPNQPKKLRVPNLTNILELPITWLVNLFQHVASGAGGVAHLAALSQTCKPFHALSDNSAIEYRNLRLDQPLHSLGHPFFRWLAKRQGRVAGLTAELQLHIVELRENKSKQLQLLFSTPGLHLTLRWIRQLGSPDDPFITKVLRPHGHLIDHLISIVCFHGDGLKLQHFCEAAAPCRSLDLTVGSSAEEPLNMGALSPVAGSLVRLNLRSSDDFPPTELECVSSLSLLSQLTSLRLDECELGAEEPWIYLEGLTSLKQLSLSVAASGDPSPLSALTGLSWLQLCSSRPALQGGLLPPFTFSSLQPLSTLQQLKELALFGKACHVTSLQGLAELSRLEALTLDGPMLESLEGVNAGLISLDIRSAQDLVSLAGIEQLQGLERLSMDSSGVSSLHGLAALGSLCSLCIGGTFTSLSGLEGGVCMSLHTLKLQSCGQLRELSGIEGLTALQTLWVHECGVTSLQPVGQLVGGLRAFYVAECSMVQEEVLELPHVQATAFVLISSSNVKVVVLAGGVRRRADLGEDTSDSEEEDEEWVTDECQVTDSGSEEWVTDSGSEGEGEGGGGH